MKRTIKIITIIIMLIISLIIIINAIVIVSTMSKIKKVNDIKDDDINCILVLGAGIRQNKPSPMLEDRLKKSIDLYNQGVATKIIVSGDHRNEDYNEVIVMKTFLVDKGIPSEDIFVDHDGYSTYDSIYRAKTIFKANKIVVVTQQYHLYRALYVSKQLDVDAYGVEANKVRYHGQSKRDAREILARIKDFFKCLEKPEATVMGEVHPVNGNGDNTNEKEFK